MIRLSAFADEADASLSGQIEALRRNQVGYIELRGINGTNISAVTEEEAKGYAKELARAGIKVWSIGSPIGKIKITDDLDEHISLLCHICRLANIFGTDKVRMFSFYEAYESEDVVFSTLRRMVDVAREYGITLFHENEKEIYGDRLERIEKIMANVEGLSYIYDPANFIEVGERPEDTMPALHSKTGYFHIKDAMWESKGIVPAGEGDGRIDELVDMIGERDVILSVEPHLAVFDGYSEFDKTEMKNRFRYSSNNEAFDAAISAIKAVLEKRGYKYENGGYTR